MAVNYSISKPAAGASRGAAQTEAARLADISDTIGDAGSRLDTLEAHDHDTDYAADDHTHDPVTVETEAGTSYTVDATDNGKVKVFTAASLVTVTLPDGLTAPILLELLFVGAGGGAVQDNGTSTVNGEGTVAQHGEASALLYATDVWNVQGTTA